MGPRRRPVGVARGVPAGSRRARVCRTRGGRGRGLRRDGRGRVGRLSFAELSASLRPSTIARNKHALRRGKLGPNARKSALGSGVTVSATATESVQQQLQRILLRSRARVMDLFREWDDDGSGTVTASEFHGALAALGYEAERPDVEALFELFDLDGSGKIDYGELHAALRDGAAALDAVDPATGESKRRKAPLRRTPTFGSRPVGGWDSAFANDASQLEGRRSDATGGAIFGARSSTSCATCARRRRPGLTRVTTARARCRRSRARAQSP